MKGTGWHEGWYMAVVEDVIDKDAGRASLVYVVEPSEVYKICVTEMLEERSMWITDGDEMEQFYEVGAKGSVKWTREEIGHKNWRAGWYVGEVQEADPQHDEITVQFIAEPESLYTYEVKSCVADGKLRMVNPCFKVPL